MRSTRFRHLLQTWMLCLILLGAQQPVQACFDVDFDEEIYIPGDHFRSQTANPGEAYYTVVNGEDFEETLEKWKKRWERDGRWRDRSRYAVCLALQGELDQALGHFLEIEAEYPGKYATAVNLATVYELKKEYKKAIDWLKKSIDIDPQAHEAAEWIHLNILYMASAGKQAKCTSKELIGQDFGTHLIPQTRSSMEELETLQRNIFFVLDQHEFLGEETDPINARLTFELGNLNFLRGFPSASLKNYELAKELGFDDPLLEKRMASVVTANYKPPVRSNEVKTFEKFMQSITEQQEAEQHKQQRRTGIVIFVILFLVVAIAVGIGLYRYYENRKHVVTKVAEQRRFEDLFRDDD